MEAEAKKQAEVKAKAEQAKSQAAIKAEKDQLAAQARMEAESRKAAQVARTKETAAVTAEPVAVVPVVPVAREERPPPTVQPSPSAPSVQRIGQQAQTREAVDVRRTSVPVVEEEPSPMAMASKTQRQETRPESVIDEDQILRQEELLVEPTKVTTIVKLEKGGTVTEYRRVFHKWGGTYYFRNGEACSQLIYEQEARPEQLAGATPRGKMD